MHWLIFVSFFFCVCIVIYFLLYYPLFQPFISSTRSSNLFPLSLGDDIKCFARGFEGQEIQQTHTNTTIISGWGEEGEWGNFLYMAWYGCACRMAPFTELPSIWLAPFFQQKIYDWPNFSWLVYERPQFIWYPGICTYVSLREFLGCLF